MEWLLMNGKLILIDGTVFEGNLLFPVDEFVGEVVFNTSMSGYQEVFTDPSYAEQIIVMTYPQIGNYGVFQDHTLCESQYIAVTPNNKISKFTCFIIERHMDLKPGKMLLC